MDTEHTHGLMEKNMKENFKTLKYMEEGNMNGQMGEYMKVNSKMILNMVMEN